MNSGKNRSVLIIGCGWLGKKLGAHLISNQKNVYGTTRSSSNFSTLNALAIKPVKLELPAVSLSDIRLPNVDSIIISISPGRDKQRSKYPKIIGQLAQVLAGVNTQIIMYSSTSVYGNIKSEVSETDAKPDSNSSSVILAAEGILLNNIPNAVILRLCGLYGEDRHPAKYMAGRKDIADGDAPVNLIHRDDVILATEEIIDAQVKDDIFNLCSGIHPSRSDVYTKIAERLELKKPMFSEGGEDEKVVSSKKFVDRFNFSFQHIDPGKFLSN